MSYQISRRNALKGIGLSGLGITATAPASGSNIKQYIVTSQGSNARRRIERHGFTIQHELEHAGISIVAGEDDAVSDLQNAPGIKGVAPDFTYTVDLPKPLSEGTEQDVDPDEQWDKELTQSFAAHDYATGEGTSIGVIDTGVAGDHPDITGNFNEDLSASFIGGEQGNKWEDRAYHGTHVAGIAAATGDNGLTGVAPDSDIVSLRVFPDDGGAPISDSFLALDYAAENDLDVVNMSIGSPPEPPQYNRNARDGWRIARKHMVQSVIQRGTSVVTSAGNDSQNLQQGGWVSLWGSLPNTLGVSASTATDELAEFSNYGTNTIGVGAPGASILSAIPEWYADQIGFERAYGLLSGTSMSSPQTAGLAALVRELNPNANPQQVETAIAQGADLVNGRSDPEFGAGRINSLDTVRDVK